MTEHILDWLQGFTAEKIHVDYLPEQPGSWGLFPQGQEQVSRREDVLGNVTKQMQCTLILRRVGLRLAEDQTLLERLCRWVDQQDQQKLLPALGENTRARAQQGRFTSGKQIGTGVYEIKLIFTYTDKE